MHAWWLASAIAGVGVNHLRKEIASKLVAEIDDKSPTDESEYICIGCPPTPAHLLHADACNVMMNRSAWDAVASTETPAINDDDNDCMHKHSVYSHRPDTGLSLDKLIFFTSFSGCHLYIPSRPASRRTERTLPSSHCLCSLVACT